MLRSISEPPLDKLEQIRQRHAKLTKVSAKGFVLCQPGKIEQANSFLKSIHSQEDDEKTLLRSIQQDVNQVIRRYKERIESITKLKVERESLKSACDFSSIYASTTPKTSVPHTKRESCNYSEDLPAVRQPAQPKIQDRHKKHVHDELQQPQPKSQQRSPAQTSLHTKYQSQKCTRRESKETTLQSEQKGHQSQTKYTFKILNEKKSNGLKNLRSNKNLLKKQSIKNQHSSNNSSGVGIKEISINLYNSTKRRNK